MEGRHGVEPNALSGVCDSEEAQVYVVFRREILVVITSPSATRRLRLIQILRRRESYNRRSPLKPTVGSRSLITTAERGTG